MRDLRKCAGLPFTMVALAGRRAYNVYVDAVLAGRVRRTRQGWAADGLTGVWSRAEEAAVALVAEVKP